MPAKLLRSAMPRAARPSASAVATISFGCEAPRRKEKFVVTASSAYEVCRESLSLERIHSCSFLRRRESKSVRSDFLGRGPGSPLAPGRPEWRGSTFAMVSSREQSMQKPAWRGGLTPINSFAIEPEAVAGRILHQVVVAGRQRLAAAPPFAGDAFRSLR